MEGRVIMFLFEKSFKVYREPFLYFTIESALDESISRKLTDEYFDGRRGKSKIWKKFIDLHISKAKEITEIFDKAFELPSEKLTPEINFPFHYPDNTPLGRDWHFDGLSKKYQIIYYMGEPDIGAGEFELANNKDGKNKVVIPFKPNRVLVFHNQMNVSWHRYFLPKKGIRKTWNMPLNYSK